MRVSKSSPFLLSLFCLCGTVVQGQIRQIQRELHRLSSAPDPVSKVNSLNQLGVLYRSRNADSSFYYGTKAKHIATNIRYRKGQTDADIVIAHALYKRGLYAESLALLSKLLSEFQRLNDTEKIVRVYLDMIEVLNKDIVDKTAIISLLQKAIQAGSTLEKDSIMAEVYMACVNRNPSLPDDSTDYYINKADEIASRYNDERMQHFIRMWRLRIEILNGQKQEALPLVEQFISEVRRKGNVNMEISGLFLMMAYYDDNPKVALDYYYQAHEVARESGDRYLEIYILTHALEVAERLGDKDEIIKVHVGLEKAWTADWENTKKFISDYVRFNAIQVDNKSLEEKNARRTLWLVVISFAASIIVLAIYLIMLRRNRKAKQQVEALNNAANMQIIAMEEAKHQAVKEEQQRLGQDLHDGLSSAIAGIKHQLEILAIDTDDASLKSKLNTLQTEVAKVYETTRNKSHEWFSGSCEQEEQSFEQRITLLTDSALPDSRYRKDIHIDDRSLLRVNPDTRISLLRIIQEAITNIIKHAKAKNVSILIYEEMDNLFMVISDDGKGFGEKKSNNGKGKSMMGQQSIRRRVQLLNGKSDIRSGSDGTEITISIPLNALSYRNS